MAPASSASRVYPLPPPDTAPHPTHLRPSKKPSQTGQKQALGLPCIPGLGDVAEWWTVPRSQEKGRDHRPRRCGCTHSQEADRLSSWDLVTQPQVLGLSNVLQVGIPRSLLTGRDLRVLRAHQQHPSRRFPLRKTWGPEWLCSRSPWPLTLLLPPQEQRSLAWCLGTLGRAERGLSLGSLRSGASLGIPGSRRDLQPF